MVAGNTPSTHRSDVVVVGGGPAAHRLVEALVSRAEPSGPRRSPCSARSRAHPYDRVALSSRLSAARRARVDLTLGDGSLWQQAASRSGPAMRVVAIDPPARSSVSTPARSTATATWSWRRARPRPSRRSRAPQRGRVYRTVEDVDALVAEVAAFAGTHGRPGERRRRRRRAARARGGRRAPRRSARSATIVHSGRWLMSAQLDEGAGQALGRIIAAQGIALRPRRPALPKCSRRRGRGRSGSASPTARERCGRHRRLLDRHHARATSWPAMRA